MMTPADIHARCDAGERALAALSETLEYRPRHTGWRRRRELQLWVARELRAVAMELEALHEDGGRE